MIRAIVSDLGNVLLFYDHSVLAECLGIHTIQNLEKKVLHTDFCVGFHEGRISVEEFYENVTNLLDLGITMEEFREAFNAIFTEPNTKLIEFLSKVRGKYRLIMLSDNNEMHVEFIQRQYPFLEMFDELIFSNEVGFTKYRSPEKIFPEAVKRAGCKPEECIFIDDLEENIMKARESGLNAILFTNNEQLFRDLNLYGIKIK